MEFSARGSELYDNEYFDYFSPVKTDYSITGSHYDIVLPVSHPAKDITQLSFACDPVTQFTDLSQSFLEFKFKVTNIDGTAIKPCVPPDDKSSNPTATAYLGCGVVNAPGD